MLQPILYEFAAINRILFETLLCVVTGMGSVILIACFLSFCMDDGKVINTKSKR